MLSRLFLAVLFLFLLSPALLMDDISLINLSQPDFIRYKLWLASVNFLDITVLTVFVILVTLRPYSILNVVLKPEIIIVMVVTLCGVALGVFNGIDYFIYIDGIIYTIRFLIVYILTAYFLKHKYGFLEELKTVIIFSSIILVTGSILAWVMGYQGIMGGRINALGMGPHVTAIFYIFVMFMIFSNLKHGKCSDKLNYSSGKFFCLFALAILSFGILLTGSRRALLYLVIAYLFFYFYIIRSVHVKFIFAIPVIILAFISLIYINDILLFLSDNGINIAGRILEMLNGKESVSNDGRFSMWWQVSKLFEQYPYGVGLSDWFIQKVMGNYGWDSHTHNLILQFYFKYSFSIILFSYFLVSIFIGIKKRIIYAVPLLIMFVDSMGGYILWNQKAMYIVCLFFVLLFYFNRRDVFNENCTFVAHAKF